MKQENDLVGFATRLRALREARGFHTQSGFAAACGVANTTANRWERGKTLPRPEELVRISELLVVSSSYLLTGKEDGAAVVHNGELAKFLASEGRALTGDQKHGLGLLLGELKRIPPPYRIRAALDLLLSDDGGRNDDEK